MCLSHKHEGTHIRKPDMLAQAEAVDRRIPAAC